MNDRIDWKIDGGLCVLVVEEYRGVAVQEHGPHVAADMRRRNAEPADLLSALGQLSTGRDGPTDAFNAKVWRRIAETVQDELAATKAKLAEVERARAGLLDEVGRAMRVVGSAQVLISSAWLNGYHELRFDAQKWDALEAALNAFRTTTSYPPSDRTEAPRDEAGESGPVDARCVYATIAYEGSPYMRPHNPCASEPTEEPKPEPQPDAPLPLPWRLEFDGTLWSVMSADGQHVADDLREADARRIVERCGREEQQPGGWPDGTRRTHLEQAAKLLLGLEENWREIEDCNGPFYDAVTSWCFEERNGAQRGALLARPERQPEVKRNDGSDQG